MKEIVKSGSAFWRGLVWGSWWCCYPLWSCWNPDAQLLWTWPRGPMLKVGGWLGTLETRRPVHYPKLLWSCCLLCREVISLSPQIPPAWSWCWWMDPEEVLFQSYAVSKLLFSPHFWAIVLEGQGSPSLYIYMYINTYKLYINFIIKNIFYIFKL